MRKINYSSLLEDMETRRVTIDVLAEFFQDSVKDDPIGVADWLAQNETSADLFCELVAKLRKEVAAMRNLGQAPGMPHAICHACGLGEQCIDPDCPNGPPRQSPATAENVTGNNS